MADIKITKNFDWETTTTPITIFMPNYHNEKLVEESLRRINTVLEPDKYTIIIGNDGYDYSWDYMRESGQPPFNRMFYFSLEHKMEQPRNGAFIRNYCLKRIQSDYFLQKDGEVVLEGDFMWRALMTGQEGYLWRPGHISVLTEEDTIKYLAGNDSFDLPMTKRIEPVTGITAQAVKEMLVAMDGQVNFTSYFHYAYCENTKILQGLQGYDEEYRYYGFEDSDMYCRLTHAGRVFRPDYRCYAIHQWHECTVNREMLFPMGKVFKAKDPKETIRNPGGWGEGA